MTDFLNANIDDLPETAPTIPAGEYHLRFVEPEIKDNKAGDGKYVNFRAVVQSGEHAGFSFFGMYSLKDKQLWQFVRDLKRLNFEGMTITEAVDALNGVEFIGAVGERDRKDRDTKQVIGRENVLKHIIGTV